MNISCTFILILLGIGTIYITSFIFLRKLKFQYFRNWYSLSNDGATGEMTWCQIGLLMDFDPLNEIPLPTRKFSCKLLAHIFWDISIGLIGIAVVLLFVEATLNICCGIENTLSSQSLFHFVVSAGLPVAIVSIAALVFQTRLQARSKNRQDWINSIREEISVLIAKFPPPGASRKEIECAAKNALPGIVKLDLYFNPSEKVHRGFMEVVRFMYGLGEQSKDFEARSKLDIPSSRLASGEDVASPTSIDMELWPLKATRLANILLKREWEQVKHVR